MTNLRSVPAESERSLPVSYKTILVYLKSTQCADSVLNVAVSLAEKNDSHVIGLFLEPDVPIYGAVEIQLSAEILAQQKAAMEEDREKVRAIFDKATHGLKGRTEWRNQACQYSEISDVIADHAFCTDLVIMSQSDQDQRALWPNLPAAVAIASGRPTLIVPSAGAFNGIGKNVLIAWNASQEAARAAFDSVPFLQNSDMVHVLSINPNPDGGHNTMGRGDDLAISLSRHGAKVEVTPSYNRDISTTDEILSRAADLNADLIVMGCYGHSRLRETLFGGASRGILQSMTVPVLMSH